MSTINAKIVEEIRKVWDLLQEERAKEPSRDRAIVIRHYEDILRYKMWRIETEDRIKAILEGSIKDESKIKDKIKVLQLMASSPSLKVIANMASNDDSLKEFDYRSVRDGLHTNIVFKFVYLGQEQFMYSIDAMRKFLINHYQSEL